MRGGHLATITSQSEQSFVIASFENGLREGQSGTWIGAYQTSKDNEPLGNWAWVTGEAWNYTNWNVAPDNYQGTQDFGYIIGDYAGFSSWDDASVNEGYTRYLLEFGYPTDPNKADTDGDGFNDAIETQYKTDPNNAAVTPNNSRPKGVVSQWLDPSVVQSPVPVALTSVIQIAAGGASYALKSDGNVVAWGEIWSGSGSVNIPAYVPIGLTNVVQIDAGINYAIALKGDGTVAVWGYFWDGYGHQSAYVPEGLGGVVQISAGIAHAAALKADGTLVVWGTGNWGQLDVPAGLSDIVQVAAGGYHTMALKRDGTVVVWGGIYSEVRDVPAGLSGVIKIAAGGHHCVALKSDGTVVAWGKNNRGQTDVPQGLANVAQISAAPHEATFAVKSDGTMVGWGDKSNLPPIASTVLDADAGWDRNLTLISDVDGDGLIDAYETNTGVYVSPTNTGTNPLDPDTSGDGILDGEGVTGGFDPNIDYTPVINFVKSQSGDGKGRFQLYDVSAILDMNLGGVTLQKAGSTVNLRLQIQSKSDLMDAQWSDQGTETFVLDMPSNKAFLRVRALGQQ